MIRSAPSIEDLNALVAQLRAELADAGTASAWISALSVPVEIWRKAARRAGRVLGRPTHTLVHGDLVQAYLTDWPSTPDEQHKRDRALREAIERTVHIALDGSAGPAPAGTPASCDRSETR
jgi:hypothetical protein